MRHESSADRLRRPSTLDQESVAPQSVRGDEEVPDRSSNWPVSAKHADACTDALDGDRALEPARESVEAKANTSARSSTKMRIVPATFAMPAPGDVLAGKYRIEAIIGRGGMSLVYSATHLQLEQLVAIKVLAGHALLVPECIARLGREARASSRIRSEHVVRILDVGELESHGVPYLVMEHLEGSDLAAVLASSKDRRLPLALAVQSVLHACEGLAAAHALGIIHRDLKPANLFLTESGDGSPCVKILDFGVSRMTDRAGLSPLTDPGIVLGTPSYMAPEQMEAAGLDERSDVWALGAILYELLVGRPPFAGDTLPKIFIEIMRSKTPRASAERADVSHDLDDVIARCLAVEAVDRFQSVAELATALARCKSADVHARDLADRVTRVRERTARGATQASLPPASAAVPTASARTTGRDLRKVGAAALVMASGALLGVLALAGIGIPRASVVAPAVAPAALEGEPSASGAVTSGADLSNRDVRERAPAPGTPPVLAAPDPGGALSLATVNRPKSADLPTPVAVATPARLVADPRSREGADVDGGAVPAEGANSDERAPSRARAVPDGIEGDPPQATD